MESIMHFLCKQHYQSLALKPSNQLSALWFEWMNQASVYYEVGLYKEAVAYAGSAIDVSLLLMGKVEDGLKGGACKKLVLATIYVTNLFKHQQEFEKACCYQTGDFDVLGRYSAQQCCMDLVAEIESCRQQLLHDERHIYFFESHVNLSIHRPPVLRDASSLH